MRRMLRSKEQREQEALSPMLYALCPLLLALLILMPEMLMAYEPGTFNLKTPTNLEKGQRELKIQHRFYGKASEEPFDTFFGIDLGANVGISLRYTVWSKIELNASRIRDRKEYTIGTSYAHPFPKVPLRSQMDVQFFSYEEFDLEKNGEEREIGVFGLLSVQSEPVFSRVIAVVNIGYDGHNQEFGAGLGLAITAFKGFGIIQRISAIGEYFPTTGESEARENSFAFGIRLETYDHHFDFILSKNSEIGVRRLMSGATKTEGLRFGFNIKRRL